MNDKTLEDRLAIRQLIDDWVMWRDTGEWDRLATTWSPGAFIMTTWCEASAEEFVERSRRSWEAGIYAFHTVNGCHVEVEGDRAIAQTKMSISQRARVHDVLVDVSCQGRFCDAFERHDGRWGLFSRQAIYEGDRMTPVKIGAQLTLDEALLASFPDGYRHLGYLQTQAGLPVNKNLPGTRDPATVEILARLRRWLVEGDRALVRSPAATM